MLEAVGVFFSTPWMWITYLCIGFVHLYIWYFIDALIIYGTLSSACIWSIVGLFDDFIVSLPGGMKRKETAIRTAAISSSHGSFVGDKIIWRYSDVRVNKNYREVANDMYISASQFWLLHVVFVFVLWPIALCIAIVLCLIAFLNFSKKRSRDKLRSRDFE